MSQTQLPWNEAFLGKHPNEQVLLILRRHWVVLFKYITELVALNILPVVLFVFLWYLDLWDFNVTSVLYVIMILIFSLYYIGIWLIYYHLFLDYRLDVWLVTNERIVDVQQQGLFNRVVSELNVANIQDVTAEIRGQVATLLDYGNIYVQTASEQHRFIFQQVPHPQAVAHLVTQANNTAIKSSHDTTRSIVS